MNLTQIAHDIESPPVTWHTLANRLLTFDKLPDWVPPMEFAKAFFKAKGIDHGTYRVYARFSTYNQPIEDDVIQVKVFKGVVIRPVESLHHGANLIKVGEMTI
jgi:hypothetical protein